MVFYHLVPNTCGLGAILLLLDALFLYVKSCLLYCLRKIFCYTLHCSVVILYFPKKLYTVYNMSINIKVSSRSLCGDVYCYALVLAPALKHWCCYALPRFLWVKWPSNHEIESSNMLTVFHYILKDNIKSESFQMLKHQWFGLKKGQTKSRNCI